MRIVEVREFPVVTRHRMVRVPCFFHSVLLEPYRLVHPGRPFFSPLTREIRLPREYELFFTVPADTLDPLPEIREGDVILIPSLPVEEEFYGRLGHLLAQLKRKDCSLIIMMNEPSPPPPCPDSTLVVNLFSVFMEPDPMSHLERWQSMLKNHGNVVWIYPILPGLSDDPVIPVIMDRLVQLEGTPRIIPVLPALNHQAVRLILDRVDSGTGDAGRAYKLLFQTARSGIEEILMNRYFEEAGTRPVEGLIPLHSTDPARRENLMLSQRAYLLWYHLLQAGEEMPAWSWYRAAGKLRDLTIGLSSLIGERNLDILRLEPEQSRSLVSMVTGESSRLHPLEKRWLP